MSLTHLVVDLETLGKKEDTVVLTLGCTAFKLEEVVDFSTLIKQSFYVKFNSQEQIEKYKRTICKDTLLWWEEQSKEARLAALKPYANDELMVDGLNKFSDFIKNSDYDPKKSYIFSRGTYFDFPKIEHMYDQVGLPLPYNSWKIRDVRTYVDILTGVDNGVYMPKVPLVNFVKHNAMHDAAKDAFCMTEIFHNALTGE